MELRKEIEAQFDIAEKRYPEILKSITDYAEFCDENGDEGNIEYEKLENKLHKLTRKDISKFNLWEWWEEEGAEVLAFRIALPNPIRVDNVTKEELSEIVRNRIECNKESKLKNDIEGQSFNEQFRFYMDQYYHEFLKINFKTYDYKRIFGQQKDKNKKVFWFTNAEKIDKLWNEGKR